MDIETSEQPEKRNKKQNDDALQQLTKQDEMSIRDWLSELGSSASIRVKVYRDAPKAWRGKNVGGHLGDLTDLIDEEQMRERWGGGKFRVQVFRVNNQGKWVHFTQRTIELSGDPKITGELFEDIPGDDSNGKSASSGEDVSLQRHAMGMTERLAIEERRRAERLETELRERNSFDPTMVSAFTEPMRMQVTAMQSSLDRMHAQLTAKDERIADLLTRKPDTTIQDRIFEKMVDGESARIDAIRTQHESELRQLRESFTSDAKRAQDHYIEEARSKDRAQEREITNLREAHKAQMEGLKVAWESRIDTLKSQIATLERDFDSTKKDLTEMRAKKDVPIEDQLSRFVALKDAFQSISGSEGEERPVWAQILEGLAPVIEGAGARLGTTTPEAVARATQTKPQVQQTVMRPTAKPANGAKAALPQPAVNPQDLTRALSFLEGAIRNNAEPAVLAASIRSMIPGPLLVTIQKQGIDPFLDALKLPEGTILNSQQGRNVLRKVAKILSEPNSAETNSSQAASSE